MQLLQQHPGLSPSHRGEVTQGIDRPPPTLCVQAQGTGFSGGTLTIFPPIHPRNRCTSKPLRYHRNPDRRRDATLKYGVPLPCCHSATQDQQGDAGMGRTTPNRPMSNSGDERIGRHRHTLRTVNIYPKLSQCNCASGILRPDLRRSQSISLPTYFCQDLLQGRILVISDPDSPTGLLPLLTYPA